MQFNRHKASVGAKSVVQLVLEKKTHRVGIVMPGDKPE
jgi:hypothetical protein